MTIAVGAPEPVADYEAAAILGAWLVLALGAWIKTPFESGLRAHVAVTRVARVRGRLRRRADGVRRLRLLQGRRLDRRGGRRLPHLRRLGSTRGRAQRGDPRRYRPARLGADPELRRRARAEELSALVADECLDLPVRLIAANQLYKEVLGHVPVGVMDAAWYRYIMHPTSAPRGRSASGSSISRSEP